jgi:hypothetical protein
MQRDNITYTDYYNRRHDREGHLYQGRYKSVLIDKNEYLSVLSRYIHLNPVKIKSHKKTFRTGENQISYSLSVEQPAGVFESEKERMVH